MADQALIDLSADGREVLAHAKAVWFEGGALSNEELSELLDLVDSIGLEDLTLARVSELRGRGWTSLCTAVSYKQA